MSDFNDENSNKNDSDFIYPERNSHQPSEQEYIETQISSDNGGSYGDRDYFDDEKKFIMKRQRSRNNSLLICVIILLIALIGVGSAFFFYINNEEFRNAFPVKESTNVTSQKQGEGPSNVIKIDESTEAAGNYTAETVNEIISPSVVAVIVYDFDSDIISEPTSQGSGVIISEDGYIVTNAHVIGNSKKYNVKIALTTEDEEPAKIIGYDTRTDIAVLKIEKNGLTAAKFADSDKVKVGSWVLAIGTPLGGLLNFERSLSRGIVSAVNRTVGSDNNKYIQTDAAINPGNSGGPLVDMNGHVIGMNTFKIIIKNYENIGFAIPSNKIQDVANDIIKNGYASGRAKLGIESRMIVGSYLGLPNGVMIRRFSDEKSDLKNHAQVGDIITEIDDKPVNNIDVIPNRIAELKPGDTVKLTIVRVTANGRNFKKFTATVKLLEDKGEEAE